MRHLLATAVTAVVLLVPASADAARPWGSPETVSHVPGTPVAAIGPGGVAVLAWSAHNAAYGARRTARRGFGEPFALYKQVHAVGFATVAYDAHGSALFAFRRYVERNHRILGATLRPSGSRTDAISLSGPGSSAYEPTFASPPAGMLAADPVALWWRRDATPPTRVQLARSFGGRLLVSANDTLPDAAGAAYAQTADGTILAATATGGRVTLSERLPGAAFGPAAVLTEGPGTVRDADVAVGGDGTVAVSWRRYVAATYRTFVSVRRPAGSFAPAVAVSGADERAVSPRVCVTSDGVVRVAFLTTAPGNAGPRSGRLRLTTLDGANRTVTAGSQTATAFDIAADGRRGVTLLWQRHERGHVGGAVLVRAVTPAGSLGKRQVLTRPGEDASGIDLAVAAGGDALAAWQTDDFHRLRAARRPAS